MAGTSEGPPGLDLVPESVWASRHPGPFNLVVTVSRDEASDKNPEWKLDGQVINVSVEASTTIEELKQRLEADIGLPLNRIKLQHPSKGFLKNRDSCAFYNLKDGDTLELTRQRRGGRK